MHQVAVLVAEQLHFDVPRPVDELFEKHVGAAEGRERLRAGPVRARRPARRRVSHDAHAAAAAALGRLEHHRIAELLGQLRWPRASVGQRLRRCRPEPARRPCRRSRGPRSCRPVVRDLGRGPTKVMPAVSQARPAPGSPTGSRSRDGSRRPRAARPDARMRVDVEIRPDRLARLADLVGLVGLEAVQGEAIFVRIDRHRADAQLVGVRNTRMAISLRLATSSLRMGFILDCNGHQPNAPAREQRRGRHSQFALAGASGWYELSTGTRLMLH